MGRKIGVIGALLLAFSSTSCAVADEGSKAASKVDALPLHEFETLNDQGGLVVRTQFATPDQVVGVNGKAWRTDGFSSWAEVTSDLGEAAAVTASSWIVLESWPSDHERPVRDLSPSSIFHQAGRREGFNVHINTFGQWGAEIETSRGTVNLAAKGKFPLYEWSHVAMTADESRGEALLYLNGEVVARAALKSGTRLKLNDNPVVLGRAKDDTGFINFTINLLNGAFDRFSVSRDALSGSEIRAEFLSFVDRLPDGEASLIVPETRFAEDHLRPRFHAMPPANWTNEPHGLIRVGETWHMFYQRTPNGPYKTQMHWGHMKSDDLVTWTNMRDALWPELQTDDFGFDMKGIWSGDVIYDGGKAFAFYTSVNHGRRLMASNPGIAMAVSEDPDLEFWEKLGPILNTEHVSDFRDPYLWKEGGTWHMLIGSAFETGGGLVYYVLGADGHQGKWVHRENFVSHPYRRMDVGSIIWEMPVFEPLADGVHILTVAPIGGEVSKYGEKSTRSVYWTGRWDGETFSPFTEVPSMLDLIPGHLSPTVERAEDGFIRAIGIVDERRSPQSQEDAGWAHTFSFPRKWFLMPDGRSLGQAPAPELNMLRGAPVGSPERFTLANDVMDIDHSFSAYEIEVKMLASEDGGVVGLDVFVSPDGSEHSRILIDQSAGTVTLDKTNSTLNMEDEEGPRILTGRYDASVFGLVQTVRAFVDGSVVDVFINDAAAFSFRAYPSRSDAKGARLIAQGAPVEVSSVTVWPLVERN